jgi:hypothetical protein
MKQLEVEELLFNPKFIAAESNPHAADLQYLFRAIYDGKAYCQAYESAVEEGRHRSEVRNRVLAYTAAGIALTAAAIAAISGAFASSAEDTADQIVAMQNMTPPTPSAAAAQNVADTSRKEKVTAIASAVIAVFAGVAALPVFDEGSARRFARSRERIEETLRNVRTHITRFNNLYSIGAADNGPAIAELRMAEEILQSTCSSRDPPRRIDGASVRAYVDASRKRYAVILGIQDALAAAIKAAPAASDVSQLESALHLVGIGRLDEAIDLLVRANVEIEVTVRELIKPPAPHGVPVETSVQIKPSH